MSRIKLVLLAALAWVACATLGFAASSNVNSLTASGAVVGTQLFYCPIGASSDLKCTAAQIAAYNYSLMSGDCTASGSGAIACTKTSGTAFSGLATLAGSTAGDLAYYNGTAWARFAGNASGTQFLSESASGVPSWASGSSSVTFTTDCPTSTQTGSTIAFDNTLPPTAETSSFSVSCGVGYHVTLSATATATIPVTSGLIAFIANDASSSQSLTLTPASGLIDGNAIEFLPPGRMVSVWSNDGTNVATDLNQLPLNAGYKSGNYYATALNWGASTVGGAWGTAGNIACGPYFVSPPGITAKAMGIKVSTADTGPNFVWMGIYSDGSDGLPNALIDSIGTTAISLATTGDKNQALANTTDYIAPGWVWLCAASNSTTGIVFGTSTAMTAALGASSVGNAIGATSTGNVGVICTGAGNAGCPAPAWASGAGSSYTPASSLHGATWTAQVNGSKVPAIVLQAN